MMSNLTCASCGRVNDAGENGVSAVAHRGSKWCASCAAIGQTADGTKYVSLPSPGRMYEGSGGDPIDA